MDPDTGRGRTASWPLGGRRAAGWIWPAGWSRASQSIRLTLKGWALADVAPGRLLPWLPVAFGTGIALYFTAEREPSAWGAIALVIVCVAASILLRRRGCKSRSNNPSLKRPIGLAAPESNCGS